MAEEHQEKCYRHHYAAICKRFERELYFPDDQASFDASYQAFENECISLCRQFGLPPQSMALHCTCGLYDYDIPAQEEFPFENKDIHSS